MYEYMMLYCRARALRRAQSGGIVCVRGGLHRPLLRHPVVPGGLRPSELYIYIYIYIYVYMLWASPATSVPPSCARRSSPPSPPLPFYSLSHHLPISPSPSLPPLLRWRRSCHFCAYIFNHMRGAQDCSGHGRCHALYGTCDCDPGFGGAACSDVLCPSNCTQVIYIYI
jgi:hypothetical protein